MYVLFLPDSRNCFFIYLAYFQICTYHIFSFFCFYFTFILLWSPRETFFNSVWFDFITNHIQFHHAIRYRKFSLNCKRFKSRKEIKRKNCYVSFNKKCFSYMCLPYSYFTRMLLVDVVPSKISLVFSWIFFGTELSFFLKFQRSRFGKIGCFL